MATEIDFRVKNGLVVGTNATITGTVTASTFVGDGSGITGATASYSTITGTVPTWNQNTTGTASKLTTARNINGVSFDGSANITINAVDSTARIASSLIGAASGVVPLDASSKILSTYLPSYVDDVLEYANLAALPVTGETGKIYVALDTNKTYRWSGSAYIYITSGAVDSVAGRTGVITLTSTDVGLGNANNTSDANKPISTATQTALDLKAPLASPTLSNPTYTGTLTGSTGILNIGSGQVYKDASGNVGIGTSSPQVRLDVIGTQWFRGASAAGAVGILAADATSGVNGISVSASFATGGYGPIIFNTSATERMRIDSSGNVGIGTSSPSTFGGKLSLVSPAATQSTIMVQVAGQGTGHFGLASSGSNLKIYNCISTGTLAGGFGIDIDYSGNVGIGTSSPACALQITDGNVSYRGQLSIDGGVGGNAQITLYNGPTTGTTNLTAQIQTNTDNVGVVIAASQTSGYLVFRTNAGSERVRIDASGNVGIGTSSPVRKLHVASVPAGGGVSVSGTAPNISITNADTEPNANTMTSIFALATAAGNYSLNAGEAAWLGLGASRGNFVINPNYSGAGTKDIILQPSSGNVGIGTSTISVPSGFSRFVAIGDSDTGIGQISDGVLAFATNNTERMRIDSSGNVGIGLTPVASNGILQLNGHASIAALLEKATITASAPAATTYFDISTQAVQYYTTTSTANFILVVRGNASTTLNTIMQIGQSLTIALLITNTTAYWPSTFQIDGVTTTIKWSGGTAPTGGNASALDCYTYTIIKTAASTYTVLGSQTKYA